MADQTYQQKVTAATATGVADADELLLFERSPDGQKGITGANLFGTGATQAARGNHGHTFLALTDVLEPDYTGHAGQYVKVNAGATGLDFGTPAGGGSGVAVQEEGSPVATATTLNFIGGGVTAADAGGGVVSVTVTGSGITDVVQDTTPQLGGALDARGNEIAHYKGKVMTGVTGTLTTAAHSGNTLILSGNVTVPNGASDVGFCANLVATGAQTITFNGTTSAALAVDDVVTVIVTSTTTIVARPSAAAEQLSFS